MIKRILFSLFIIGATGAIAYNATQAFFSDTETSTGNILGAGTINLWIGNSGLLNGTPIPSWAPRNLTNEKFFNFTDVKPGDWGSNTITIQPKSDNNYWACMKIFDMLNSENTLVEPELELSDNNDSGELAQNIEVFAWMDTNENGLYDADEGSPLFTNPSGIGKASDILGGDKIYPIAESGMPYLPGTVSQKLGIIWCLGDLSFTTEDNKPICDGSKILNDVQTDTLTASIAFYAEQARNNDQFKCSSWETPTSP